MLRLKTLGGLSIDGAQHPLSGAALQGRRLALLAVAAAASPQGISRDKLVGLFWPEVDEEHARHALAQALYALRRALGVDDLFLGAQNLRLNSAVIDVDSWEFEHALGAGELERAAGAYAGAFLDGVYLDDAPAFEQWVEAERERLAQSHMRALESLASAADAAGDAVGAARWWRQLAATDPLGARPALGLMRALAASGDSAAALRHARVYETMLRAELDVAAAPEVVDFARRLREEPAPTAPTPRAGGGTFPTGPLDPAGAALPRTAEPGDESRVPAAAVFGAAARRRPRAMLAFAASVLVVGLVGLAGIVRVTGGTEAGAARLDPNLLAVFPFRVYGDSASYLREGMVDLLSAALDGAGSLRVVDPRVMLSRVTRDDAWGVASDPARAARIASDLGSGLFVLGNVTQVGQRVQVRVTLYDAANPRAPIAQASASGESDATFDVVDRIAAALLANRSSAPGERLARVAAVTTSSLPALKAYLAGERELRARHYAMAGDAFRRAVSYDSTFALAFYRLSIAADWMGNLALADSAAAIAARYAHRLSLPDRMLVEASLAWRRLDFDDAERRYKAILLYAPNDVETWYQLGEIYFHNNPARGLSFLDARAPFERTLAFEPNNKDALVHLMRIAAWEQRWDLVASLVKRVDPEKEDATLSPYRALADGDAAALEHAVAALAVVDVHALYTTAYRLAVYTHRIDVAAQTAAPLTSAARPAAERAVGFRVLANLSAARGRWRESRAYADSLRVLAPHFALETRARLAMVPFSPYTSDELLSLRDSLHLWRGIRADTTELLGYGRFAAREYGLRLTALAGLLAGRAGDSTGVRAAARAMNGDRTAGPVEWNHWRRDRGAMLRATLLRAEGRHADAIAVLMPVSPPDGWGSRGEERMLAAELYRDAGRLDDAVRWFGSFEHMGVEDLPWAASAHFERGELLERLGRRAEAVAEYERVAELWQDCDAELRPMLKEAQARAARLRRLSRRERDKVLGSH